MQRPSNTKLNERGFASIVIALILIIVLALLTVGFAQLARREQQTALDKQKATQANYAAESGINNAYKDIINTNPATGLKYINDSNASSTQCMTGPSGAAGTTKSLPATALTANQNINATNGVTYSCVLVELNTSSLQVDDLSPNSGRHMMFNTTTPLSSLKITWGSATGRTSFAPSLDPNSPNLPTLGNWPYPPVVEFSITPANGIPAVNPDQFLRDNTFTFYGYPATGSANGSINYTPGGAAQAAGSCPGTGAYPCSVTLNNLGGQQYIIHFVDFYDTSNILITGTSTTGGSTSFTGEPIIDVTGKARDVLKRLRVRLFINGGSGSTPDDNAILPNGAVEAQNLCKRIQAAPPTADFPTGSTFDTGTSSSCNLSN